MYHNDEVMTNWKDSVLTKEEFEAKQEDKVTYFFPEGTAVDTGESVEFTTYEETNSFSPERVNTKNKTFLDSSAMELKKLFIDCHENSINPYELMARQVVTDDAGGKIEAAFKKAYHAWLYGWKDHVTAEDVHRLARGESMASIRAAEALDSETLDEHAKHAYVTWHANPYKPVEPQESSYWESEAGALYFKKFNSLLAATLKTCQWSDSHCEFIVARVKNKEQSTVTSEDVKEFRQELEKIIQKKE